MKRGFTLIELMIVVSILGIMAAIVIPHFQDHQQQARRAAARDILRTVRGQIELYKLHHNGTPPGYQHGSPAPLTTLRNQFIGTSSADGMASVSREPAGQYIYGPYLQRFPVNPFNGLDTIKYVPQDSDFVADEDSSTARTGWLYKRETAEFRLNTPGTDPDGTSYVNY